MCNHNMQLLVYTFFAFPLSQMPQCHDSHTKVSMQIKAEHATHTNKEVDRSNKQPHNLTPPNQSICLP